MRKLTLILLFVLFVLFPKIALGAIVASTTSLQQDKGGDVDPWVFSYQSSPPAGAMSVVIGIVDSQISQSVGTPVCTVTDDQSNTYTVVESYLRDTVDTDFFIIGLVAYSIGIAASTSDVTVTCHAATYASLRAIAFTGTSIVVDQSGTNFNHGPQSSDATVATSGAVTATSELILAVAGICNSVANMNITTPSGFTEILLQNDCFNYTAGEAAYRIASGLTGTQTVSWTHDDVTNSSNYDGWAALVVTFKETGGAPTITRRRAVIVQ